MSKKPSEKTQLANERRLVKRLRVEMAEVQRNLTHYRARATQAEQECAEWKRRFDLLLARTPEQRSANGEQS